MYIFESINNINERNYIMAKYGNIGGIGEPDKIPPKRDDRDLDGDGKVSKGDFKDTTVFQMEIATRAGAMGKSWDKYDGLIEKYKQSQEAQEVKTIQKKKKKKTNHHFLKALIYS